MPETIVVIDEETIQREFLQHILTKNLGYRTIGMADTQAAVEHLFSNQLPLPSVLFFHVTAPFVKNMEFIRSVRLHMPDLPIIALINHTELEYAAEVMHAGAIDFLIKPAPVERIRVSLHNALRLKQLSEEIHRLRAGMFSDSDEWGIQDFKQRKDLHSPLVEMHGQGNSISLLGRDGNIRTLEEIENEIIHFALKHYEHHMSEIARKLGIGRSTLYRKIHAMGLNADSEIETQAA